MVRIDNKTNTPILSFLAKVNRHITFLFQFKFKLFIFWPSEKFKGEILTIIQAFIKKIWFVLHEQRRNHKQRKLYLHGVVGIHVFIT